MPTARSRTCCSRTTARWSRSTGATESGSTVIRSAALGAPDGDLPHREIEIFDSQLERLKQPETGAVHQQSCDAGSLAETREQRPHLVLGEHHGKPGWLLGSEERRVGK